MKRTILHIILFLIPVTILGQNATVISGQGGKPFKTVTYKFGEHSSIVFPKEYQPCFNQDYLSNRFMLDSITVELVEKKLEEQLIEAHKRYLKAEWKDLKKNKASYDWDKLVKNKAHREKSIIKAAEKEQKRLFKIHRQYLGLINKKGEQIILIQTVDLRNDDFDLKNSLDKEWITGFGEWFEENTARFEYVIDRDKLYFFGWTER